MFSGNAGAAGIHATDIQTGRFMCYAHRHAAVQKFYGLEPDLLSDPRVLRLTFLGVAFSPFFNAIFCCCAAARSSMAS